MEVIEKAAVEVAKPAAPQRSRPKTRLTALGVILSLGAGIVVFPVAIAALAAIGVLAWWALRAFTTQPGVWLSTIWLVGLGAVALCAPLLPLGVHNKPSETLADPANLEPFEDWAHPLGTDKFGLDILAQCLYGARVSLMTALLAVALSALAGLAIGIAAGYLRGRTDVVVGIVTDALLAFPPLILLIALAAMVGVPSSVDEAVLKSGVALALVCLPSLVRLARANTMRFSSREFVTAASALGASSKRIMAREVLPNVLIPVGNYVFVLLAVLIIAEGSLSFLGLGLQKPEPTWGNMIAGGSDINSLRNTPHVAFTAGAFMFLTVYAFSYLGEATKNAWEHRGGKL